MTKILVVEDDRSLSEALAYNLRREGYTPLVATDAGAAFEAVRQEKPDLVILDLMLPGGSGFDVCRVIRAESTVPIIILTARDEDVDRVLGLEIGADDYVTKPFSLRELLARVKANLRRVDMDRAESDEARLQWNGLTVDIERRAVVANGQAISLQPKEFNLLVYFMQHPGIVLTRDRVLQAVWGHDYVGARTVDVHVRRVRAKLENAGLADPIRTIHGVGYAFETSPFAEEATS